jgi:hypothetical protein
MMEPLLSGSRKTRWGFPSILTYKSFGTIIPSKRLVTK